LKKKEVKIEKKSKKKKRKQKEFEEDLELAGDGHEVWYIFRFFLILGMIFFGLYLANGYLFCIKTCKDNGVKASIAKGSIFIVDEISDHVKDYERFELVALKDQDGKAMVRRILGLPGEKVFIGGDGTIYIDGKPLEYPYLYQPIKDPGYLQTAVTLPENYYLVLADDPEGYEDSRSLNKEGTASLGMVYDTEIYGRAWFKIFPFGDFGLIKID